MHEWQENVLNIIKFILIEIQFLLLYKREMSFNIWKNFSFSNEEPNKMILINLKSDNTRERNE